MFFFQMSTIKTFESILDLYANTLTPRLYPERDYAGGQLSNEDRKMLGNLVNYRMGQLRIRQARVKTGNGKPLVKCV